jgi:quercetin dioxygenase-like cupin family protein
MIFEHPTRFREWRFAMKVTVSAVALTLAGAAFTLPVSAADESKVFTPQDVKWSPGPASLQKGAEFAVLFGDPSKEGPFAMRIKFPKDFQVAPHSHPKPEVLTVISGTFRFGMGETADPGKSQALPAGGFISMAPGMIHYVSADEETVIQLNSVGPWIVSYVNPKDDPRQKTQ